MTIPFSNAICVDNYIVTLTELGVIRASMVKEEVVTDPTQNSYSFVFPGIDLCREILPNYSATAVAISNGAEGSKAIMSSSPVNIDKTRIITSNLSATQMFTSAGVNVTLSWEVIDPDIINRFEVACHSIANPETSLDCTYQTIGPTQARVLIPYSSDLSKDNMGMTFNLTYQYLSCIDNGTIDFRVRNVNGSLPRVTSEQTAVEVEFNEALFDVNSIVRVMFSSNCSTSSIVEYDNPLSIPIPDTSMNIGLQCQYAILLMDGNLGQIGYPVLGSYVPIRGPASAPGLTIIPGGLTSLIVQMTTPSTGAICVDSYIVTLTEQDVTEPPITIQKIVTDATQSLYDFVFPGIDLCRESLPSYTATAVAVTNGTEGSKAMLSPTSINVNKMRIITSAVLVTQMFNTSGVEVILSWEVIDQNITNNFDVTCHFLGKPEMSLNCTYCSIGVTQMIVLLPYDDGWSEGMGVTFTLTYQYLSCMESRGIDFKVRNVNSSLPQVTSDKTAVRVEFNETLFDINSVARINFSSNCSVSSIVDYENPISIPIPDTSMNIGQPLQCQYSILLMDDNSQQIGYPVLGNFVSNAPSGGNSVLSVLLPLIGAGLGVLLILLIVFIFICIKRKSHKNINPPYKYDYTVKPPPPESAAREEFDESSNVVKKTESGSGTTITVQDVAAKADINRMEILDQECSRKVLLSLAKRCVEWQRIGRHLSLTEADIAAVDGDNRTVEEKRIGMLVKWKEKYSTEATYRVFIEALLLCDKASDALDACEDIRSSAME